MLSNIRLYLFISITSLTVSTFSGEESTPDGRLLAGRTFTCCALTRYPLLFKYGESETAEPSLAGLAIDYLRLLEKRLGFRCEFHEIVPSTVGSQSFIEDMQHCAPDSPFPQGKLCSCEIGIGGWMHTARRRSLVKFIPAFMQMDIRVARKLGSLQRGDNNAFITAFSPKIWITAFSLLLFMLSLKTLDRIFNDVETPTSDSKTIAVKSETKDGRVENEKDSTVCSEIQVDDQESISHEEIGAQKKYFSPSTISKFGKTVKRTRKISIKHIWKAHVEALAEILGATANELNNYAPRFSSVFLRLLFITVTFILLIIYEAAFVTTVLPERDDSIYLTANDFRTCNIAPESVCVIRGSEAANIWNSSIASHKCHNGRKANFVADDLSFNPTVLVSKQFDPCEFLITETINGEISDLGATSRFELIGDPLLWGDISFIFPTNTWEEVINAFGLATIQLKDEGKIEAIYHRFYPRRANKKTKPFRNIRFEHTKSLFLFTFGMAGLYFPLTFSSSMVTRLISFSSEK